MNDEKLIFLVQNNSFLYDNSAALFRQKDAKDNAWLAISKEMQTTVDICIRRWNSLRELYSREVRQYTPSGSGNDVTPTWHLYSAMNFLQPFIKPRRTRGSSNILANDSCDVISPDFNIIEEPFSTISTSPGHSDMITDYNGSIAHEATSEESEPSTSSRKRKRSMCSVDKAILEALADFKKVCQSPTQTKNIAVESFVRMITATITEMSDAKQTKAMREVTALVMAIKEEQE